jgi:DNA-binding LytR/AlgR family response regulator
MNRIKIGIVEDDMIIAETLSAMLQELNYEVTLQAARYGEAIAMIEDEKPDLLLLDINLVWRLTGIDVAKIVNEKYSIPFIFLTAKSDAQTLELAKEVQPMAYLTKPFTRELLHAAIEIAFSNYNKTTITNRSNLAKTNTAARDYLFVKDGYSFVKIFFKEILFLESEENYVAIHRENGKKILARDTFQDFLEVIDKSLIIRINRSYAINIKMVDTVQGNEVIIKGNTIPIGKSYKEGLFKILGIKE